MTREEAVDEYLRIYGTKFREDEESARKTLLLLMVTFGLQRAGEEFSKVVPRS